MEERVVLVMSAASPKPTVTAGSTRLSQPAFTARWKQTQLQ